MTTEKKWTVNAIQEAMRADGSHWWDPDTMRSFGTKALSVVYQGPGGVFFVTQDDQYRRELPKRFTVRQFDPETCNVKTFGELNGYKTAAAAQEAAQEAASDGGEATQADEDHRPISVLEQFVTDLDKHSSDPSKVKTVDAKRLMTHAKRHHRLMELLCSDEQFNRDVDAEGNHPQITDCRARCEQAAKRLGASGVIFSGDPRGCTVKLTFKDGFTNDFGKEGYCVPTGDDE